MPLKTSYNVIFAPNNQLYMKNIQSIVTGVLAVAVIILFILHFTGKGNGTVKAPPTDTSLVNKGVVRIKFVRADSLTTGYDFAKDLSAKFEEDNKLREQKIQQKQQYFQSRMGKYEKEVYTMTDRERAKEEEELGKLQQQLMAESQELQGLAQQQNQEMMIQLEDSLVLFFREFAKEVGADIILSTNTIGSNVLYINEAMDVTTQALVGLNERYKKSKGNQPDNKPVTAPAK